MSMIGTGYNHLPAAGGCGGMAPAIRPRPLPAGGPADFAIPGLAAQAPAMGFGDERFISTQQGGVIIDKDGNPAGRVPAGAFVDTKDGALYGPDSKPLTLPEGGTVDFHDLPDLEELLKQVRGGGDELRGPRFINSTAGGVIVGSDGAIAGRVPAGSFVDAKDGKVYGPDSKPIAVPDGAKVDFFDMPDLDELLKQVRGGGADAPDKALLVSGQWGPGGVTDFKGGTQVGGAHGPGGCDMDHGPKATKAGGPGASAQTQRTLDQLGRSLASTMGRANPVLGGGLGSAVGGASSLGTIPSLQVSLEELVKTLTELTRALQATGGGTTTVQQGAGQAPPKTTSTPSTDSGSTSSNPSSSSETTTS